MSLRAVPPYVPPPTRLPVAPRARGLVMLYGDRTELVEGSSVRELYEAAESLGGELVEVSPGGAPAELRWPAA